MPDGGRASKGFGVTSPGDPPAGSSVRAAGCVAAGLLGALIVPGHPAGLGLALALVGSGAAIVVARPPPRSWRAVIFAACALVMSIFVVVRAAGWLQWMDVAAAFLLTSYAVSGGRTWMAIVKSGLSPFGRVVRVPAMVLGPVVAAAGRGSWGRALPAARGVSMAVVLVVVFGTLFASADRAFAHLASEALDGDVSVWSLWQRAVVFRC
jgi:hypothetical protein